MNSKMIGLIVAVVVSVAVGFGIATFMNSQKIALDKNNNSGPVFQSYSAMDMEQLTTELSNIMLPEDEYNKLGSAILQSAMGLFMAQAQGAGISIDDKAQDELKSRIDNKYSRRYFTEMNANSMKELSKEDLIGILSFYSTEAGQKFLVLSPKIIESTMMAVQNDLSQWLPVTVNEVVAKIKEGGSQPSNAEQPAGEGIKEEPKQEQADS